MAEAAGVGHSSFLPVFFVHLLRDTLNKLLQLIISIHLQIRVSCAVSILGIRVCRIACNSPPSHSAARSIL